MKLFTTKETVVHYAPTPESFINGGDGYQAIIRVTYFCGIPVKSVELDRENVPHYHYVQVSTLGSSEWRSRLLKETP